VTEARKALVTGASRGIGAAIAQRLTGDGMEVVTLDLREGCDIALDVARDAFPPLDDIDVCVANAGVTTTIAPAHRMTAEQWQRDIDVNLTGAFRTVQACLGGMRERGFGRIVVISSVAAIGGLPGQVAYAASKAGQLGMVRTLAGESAAHGITVNAILPGLVAGDRQRRVLEAKAQQRGISYAEMERTAFSYTSIKDYVTPEQIADQILFMCSPRGRTISGQAISICGDTQMLG
jgi:NAD(P)-dependent dehydrogenase (short-subunit alcohol dehydrogenase family)